jgi:predicted DNA-binding transcriptional regulator AlpA
LRKAAHDEDARVTDDAPDTSTDDELIDIDELCIELGGKTKPLNRATPYRMIRRGEFRPPIHPSPGVSRWYRRWVREHKRRLAGE